MIYSPDARQIIIIIIIIQTVANHYSASDMTSLVSNRSPSFLIAVSFFRASPLLPSTLQLSELTLRHLISSKPMAGTYRFLVVVN